MGEEYNYTAMMDDIDRMNREEEELLFCKLLHSYIYRIEKILQKKSISILGCKIEAITKQQRLVH